MRVKITQPDTEMMEEAHVIHYPSLHPHKINNVMIGIDKELCFIR